jgi:hypothetical protein
VSSADLFEFLTESFRVFEREMPDSYRRLGQSLRDCRIRLSAEGREKTLLVDGSGLRWVDEAPAAHLRAAVDRETLLGLVDGDVSLEESILSERIQLRGGLDVLDRFWDALMIYLQGAVRSPSLPFLLDAYRNSSTPEFSKTAAKP